MKTVKKFWERGSLTRSLGPRVSDSLFWERGSLRVGDSRTQTAGQRPALPGRPLTKLFSAGALALFLLSFAPAALHAQDAAPPSVADPDDTPAAVTTTIAPAPAAKPEIRRENLVTNSPFRSARVIRRTGGNVQQLEIRGFFGTGEDLEVSLTNPLTRECHWVRVRDRDSRWFVESADPVARIAVVNMNGIIMTVNMAKVDEAPLAINSPVAAPTGIMPRPPGAGGVVGPVGPGNIPMMGGGRQAGVGAGGGMGGAGQAGEAGAGNRWGRDRSGAGNVAGAAEYRGATTVETGRGNRGAASGGTGGGSSGNTQRRQRN